MRAIAKSVLSWAFGYDPELAHVRRELRRLSASKGGPLRVLDVGCGYGRYLRVLAEEGHEAVGVDLNPDIVAANLAKGFRCFGPGDLNGTHTNFDAALLSHVISHVPPSDLLGLIDSTLDRIRPGGALLVCTPLLSPWFYEDFDIVKPYQPSGLLMVFGGEKAQVQYYARNRLRLVSLWYRRGYFRFQHQPARYLRSWRSRLVLLCDFLGASAFRLSCGCLGRRDGWVGVFEKS